ncbi:MULTISPECIES: hypothetical protein [Variovorax]|jgi:hypothetical protein|uniref:hypothetical protein n=1 Tax=Variovorax TaxID=34072 RepID=UPI00089D127E|nr:MULTISPECIES: hypothetical protein [Variovorax]MDQ0085609.1 hypothetical protein [Variovorax boronicumulans]SDZ66267.1 hypothetical protein SAMN05518854_109383 [Variovorax sp. YR266]
MPRHLKRTGQHLYVDGLHLLGICERLMKEAVLAGAPGGAGTPAAPYTMANAGDWVARWRASTREGMVYYKMAGRLISKNHKVYVGDVGPAYLQSTSILESSLKAFRSKYGRLPKLNLHFGYAVTSITVIRAALNVDNATWKALRIEQTGTPPPTWTASILSTHLIAMARTPGASSNDPNDYIDAKDRELLQEWATKNAINDPQYQVLAQRVADPGLIYAKSTDSVYGGTRPAPWSEIRHSPVIAKAVRSLMKGESPSLAAGPAGYDKDYARKQLLLPVMTMAIFHAEPARNPRAWPINLMILDLAESTTARFTWDAILWHPLAIPQSATTGAGHVLAVPLSGPRGPHAPLVPFVGPQPTQQEKTAQARAERAIVPITSTLKLHLVGGLIPASPTDGGRIGGRPLWSQNRFAATEPFDFIHQKEIDVLLQWLMQFPEIGTHWSVQDPPPHGATLVPAMQVLQRQVPADVATTTGLTRIAARLQTRIGTLDYMH